MANKLNARKKVVDDITFDSILEADYYVHLKEQKAKGEIYDFEVKPTYELIPKFIKNGKTNRPTHYIPDFKIWTKENNFFLADTKGFQTDTFKLKNKLFDYIYPTIELKLICRDGFGGFITLQEKAEKDRAAKRKARIKEKDKAKRIALKEKAIARAAKKKV